MARVWSCLLLALLCLGLAAPARAEIRFDKKFSAVDQGRNVFALDLSLRMFPELRTVVVDPAVRITLTSAENLEEATKEYYAKRGITHLGEEEKLERAAHKVRIAVTIPDPNEPLAFRIIVLEQLYADRLQALLQMAVAHELKHVTCIYDRRTGRRPAPKPRTEKHRILEEIEVHSAILTGVIAYAETDAFRDFIEDRLPESQHAVYLRVLLHFLGGEEDVLQWYEERLNSLRKPVKQSAAPRGRPLCFWYN